MRPRPTLPVWNLQIGRLRLSRRGGLRSGRLDRAPRRRQHVPIKVDTMPAVEIVAMYGGADGSLLQAAVDHGAKGLVIEALGLGNVNQPMFAAIKEAIGKGIPVVITSRVPNGRVLANYGFDGGDKTLVDAGASWATTFAAEGSHFADAAAPERRGGAERARAAGSRVRRDALLRAHGKRTTCLPRRPSMSGTPSRVTAGSGPLRRAPTTSCPGARPPL